MSAFTLHSRGTLKAPQNSFGAEAPFTRFARNIRAKRNRANRSSLSRKRFDATEDRSFRRPEGQTTTEVMHPINPVGRAHEN
jgi:hypothetical protein